MANINNIIVTCHDKDGMQIHRHRKGGGGWAPRARVPVHALAARPEGMSAGGECSPSHRRRKLLAF